MPSIYPDSFWICINGHKNASREDDRDPGTCRECGTPLIKWVPEGTLLTGVDVKTILVQPWRP